MEEIIVGTNEPTRLDRYIKRYFPSTTQGIIERSLRKGYIKVNGKKSKTNLRIVHGDRITHITNLFAQKSRESAKSFSKSCISLARKILSEYLLYSSNEFIAIDKPSGIAVQGGSKISLSIDDALAYLNQDDHSEYKLVHRLDKDTSGILLIANGHDSAAKLGLAFQDSLVQKTYVAITSGVPENPQGTLINNIGKDRSGVFEVVKELKQGGKRAKTSYKVLAYENRKSLIEFKPETGRMHQLRFSRKDPRMPDRWR